MKKFYSSRRSNSSNNTNNKTNDSNGINDPSASSSSSISSARTTSASSWWIKYGLLFALSGIAFVAGFLSHVQLGANNHIDQSAVQSSVSTAVAPSLPASSSPVFAVPVSTVEAKSSRGDDDAKLEHNEIGINEEKGKGNISKETEGIADSSEKVKAAATVSAVANAPIAPVSTIRPFITDLSSFKAEYQHRKFFFNDKTELNYVFSKGSSQVPLQGVVLLVHGCSAHHQFAWYPHSSELCGNCTARPMESLIFKSLYVNGYTTISTEPISYRCWSDRDGEHVGAIIRALYSVLQYDFETVPLYALGVANGAKLLINIARQTHFFGGYPIRRIACLNGGLWSTPSPVRNYAPVLFVDMARNVELCIQNNITVHKFNSRGVLALQETLLPTPITPLFFHQYHVLSEADSKKLQQAFLERGIIWPGSLILMESPFGAMSNMWKDAARVVLPHIIPAIDNLDRTNSALFQLVSMAWGLNEVTPVCLPKVHEFFQES